jgi:uncharacterized protein (TIGR03437 family)
MHTHALIGSLLLSAVSALPAPAANQILFRTLGNLETAARRLAVSANGQVFVASDSTDTSGLATLRLAKLDSNGSALATLNIPGGPSPTAAVTDAQGFLVVSGWDTPSQQGVVIKVDPQLRSVVFSKFLPGFVQAVAVDSSNNIYLTGSTGSSKFPVTAGAFQTKPPGGDNYGTAGYAFLTKLSPGGDQILYSTYFGDDFTNCSGGSACIGKFGITGGTAIRLDSSGAVWIAGTTTANHLPVTKGTIGETCLCSNKNTAGFIARFRPSASQQLEWATYLGATTFQYLGVAVEALDLDATGNPIVGGSAPAGLPTTAGTVQPQADSNAIAESFLLKLNQSGTAVLWGTYFGGSRGAVSVLRVGPAGEVIFTGYSTPPRDPASLQTQLYSNYVARLSPAGDVLQDLFNAPAGVVGDALDISPAGAFAAIGMLGTLWLETGAPGPSLLAVTHSATGSFGPLARTELITLYGVGIGPQAPINGLPQGGAYPTTLGGYQVLLDGNPAPLLYASSGQINAVVPRGVGVSARLSLATPSGTVEGPALPVDFAATPGVFLDSRTGLAAALNQDGTINSRANPARAGSVVSVYATGAGANYFPDGAVVPLSIFNATGPVWVVSSTRSLEVAFAGDAPGIVAGVMQVNFRIPASIPPATGTLAFRLVVSGATSPEFSIAVAP